jgi:hypothetical protein
MHTALVSRILRDKSLWDEVTVPGDAEEHEIPRSSEAAAGSSL